MSRAISAGAESILGRVYIMPDGGSLSLIDYAGTDESIVIRARQSTAGESVNTALIRWLLRQDPPHWGPFERVRLVLRLSMPIALARQWMRTRAGDYGELSRRYCSPSKANVELANVEDDVYRYEEQAVGNYRMLTAAGIPSERARYAAPLGMMTTLEMGIDLRSALWLVVQRGEARVPWRSAHAQTEIRPYATALETVIQIGWPVTWAAWVEYHRDALRLSSTEARSLRRILAANPEVAREFMQQCDGSVRECEERQVRMGVSQP